MKNTFFCIGIVFAWVLSLSIGHANVESAPDLSLNKKLTHILSQFKENINLGIMVEDLQTGKVLYKKNVDRYFVTASNQKLFTAWAALYYFNPNFTYQTQLFTDISTLKNGILNNNVYLKFSGDPTLTFAQLDHLVASLRQAGVIQINGNIVIDDTAFDDVTLSPGSTWDDQDFCFGSPISSLILDHNCVLATLTPSITPHQMAVLSLPNQPQFVHFINQVYTDNTNTPCKLVSKTSNDYTFILSGCVKTNDPPRLLKFAIKNPRLNMQSAIVYLFKKHGIVITNHLEFRKMDSSSKLIASESSQPISLLVKTMLKESDNTIANSLFKTMGSIYAQQAGSWENGHFALHALITKTTGLNIPQTTLIDGAGGSRYNYVTPEHIITLLRKIYLSTHANEFISALPVAGIDGTLKDRMTDPSTRGRIYAKTGSESAVTALSGYIITKKNHKLVFSILINGFVDSPNKYKALEDKLCRAMVND